MRFKEKVSIKWSVVLEKARGSAWSGGREQKREMDGWKERQRETERPRDMTKTLLH